LHKDETLQEGNKYGNKTIIIHTFVSRIYRDQKHLIKSRTTEKLNYSHQSIVGMWFVLDQRSPTLDASQKPTKLSLQSKKIIQNVNKY
jgi:hypothetical protein